MHVPSNSPLITVQIIYARAGQQTLLTCSLPAASSAQQAVERSGILSQHPEIPWPGSKLGIFGKIIAPDTRLEAGDRIEIYRPLIIDPKESRRQRALSAKKGSRY